MRGWILVLFCLLSGSNGTGFALQQEGSALGMVLLVRGEGEIRRGGAPRPLQIGTLLYEGDQLRLQRGEASFVFCPSSQTLQLEAGAEVQLTSGEATHLAGPPPEVTGGRCSLPRVALGDESLERVGGLRARGKPPVVVYLGGPVSTGEITLSWAAVEGADNYSVSLLDAFGNPLWQGETRSPELDLSEVYEALKPGEYSWTVSAEKERRIIAEQSTAFEVREEVAEGTRFEDQTPARLLLLRAMELENLGYYAEAARSIRLLLDETGEEDPRFRKRLAWLYWKAGLFPAFNAETGRLREEGVLE